MYTPLIHSPTCANTNIISFLTMPNPLKTGCFAKVGSMTTCVLPFSILLIVSFSFAFLRPPAAQEREGALLVLTSPSVTLTSHYQIQLVVGPALLLKQRVPLSPLPIPADPPPVSALSLPLPVTQPCSRLTCVHHGDKAEEVCSLVLTSPPSTPSPAAVQALARREPR